MNADIETDEVGFLQNEPERQIDVDPENIERPNAAPDADEG